MIKIDQALTSTLLAGGLAVDIAHENGAFSTWNGAAYVSETGVYDPSTERPYIEEKVSPTGAISHDLNNTNENVGVYECIVRYPVDGGAFSAKTKAEAVVALFPTGASITYSGQVVNIRSATRTGGVVDGGFYMIATRINYVAYVPK